MNLLHKNSHAALRSLVLVAMAAVLLGSALPVAAQPAKPPVMIGLDGEFSLQGSTSAQAVEMGLRVALAEINAAGGVLGGRPLELVTKDNRTNPARGVANMKAFQVLPDLVAVFGARFSPVVAEIAKAAAGSGPVLLAAWSSANPITDNGQHPNWVFRLSLYDDLAMPAMIGRAKRLGRAKMGLLLANTNWGRSNLLAAERYVSNTAGVGIVGVEWYNWGEKTLLAHYRRLVAQGADQLILVANDREGLVLVRELADLPATERLPVISHWGVTGADFAGKVGPDALAKVEFVVVQTFSFLRADAKKVARFIKSAEPLYGVLQPEQIPSPVGVGHAYDLTHILARAIDQAGSTDRAKVRAALEQVRSHDGLVRRFDPPFTAERHEALNEGDVFFVQFRADGALIPVK